jgi:hypothetical protein
LAAEASSLLAHVLRFGLRGHAELLRAALLPRAALAAVEGTLARLREGLGDQGSLGPEADAALEDARAAAAERCPAPGPPRPA